ncbi:response regulator receiver protein [Spirosoma radiotolerans]|uniref:Response regulator receiver protein n=2 Tax=Spirosoma radiotolerans TaxID=1379870 RepID=A0A0E4A1N4_9BACT|nr:response regulator receiver protein [Spirosoma radiotolerans]
MPAGALKMYVRTSGHLDLPVSDLMFLQATGNYSWLYWKDGQRMLMPRTLKYYVPQLPDNWFVRLHRNCIVNLHYIDRMERADPDKGGLVHLRSGAVLPVSRRRWFAVRRMLSKYAKSN